MCRIVLLASFDLLGDGKNGLSLSHAEGSELYRRRQVLMSSRTGPGQRPARPATGSRPARSFPPHGEQTQDARPSSGDFAVDAREASLDAYIAKLLDDAPPLTSEQRDKLALLLRGRS
jgi:hypothetical protein